MNQGLEEVEFCLHGLGICDPSFKGPVVVDAVQAWVHLQSKIS